MCGATSTDRQRVSYGEHIIRYRACYLTQKQHKVAIHVHPSGSVQVDAPETAQAIDIKKAVLKRAHWVIHHLNQIEEQQQNVLPREYISGETHFYPGRRYRIKAYKRKSESVKLLQSKIVIHSKDKSAEPVRKHLWRWYKTRCTDVFQKRLEAVLKNSTRGLSTG